MSWMGSWSRPSKTEAVPPPYYLTQPDTPYCHACGRLIGTRKANAGKVGVKYCSERCKRTKPSTAPGSLDSKIEAALKALLLGQDVPTIGEDGAEITTVSRPKPKPKKGDPRVIVQLSEVETAVFGDRKDPQKVYGRRKNRAARGVQTKEWQSVDMVDPKPPGSGAVNQDDSSSEDDSPSDFSMDEDVGGVSINDHIRLPQSTAEVNFSAEGGERGRNEKIEETPEMLRLRREGQKRAEEKEQVKRCARRAVVFGLTIDNEEAPVRAKQSKRKGPEANDNYSAQVVKKCEALMQGSVVEPSFAKGDWSIRWRED